MAYSSLLSIVELGSPGSDLPRKVILVGAGLPLMGANWSGENNLVTTWYNGNGDEATQQNLGPRELPSNWNGEWNRTRLGRSPCTYFDETGTAITVVDPKVLWDVLESIFRAGLRLRVTWAVTSNTGDPSQEGRVVREGRAKKWDFKPARLQDVDWAVEFHWQSRGQATQKVSARSPTVVGDDGKLTNAINALIALNTLASQAQFLPKAFTLGQLEQLAAYPSKLATSISRQVQQATSTVGQVVNIAKTLASQPAHVANALVDQAHNSISQVNNFRDTLGQVPYELMSTQNKADAMLRAANHFNQMSDAAVDIARSAATLAKQLRQQQMQAGLTGALDMKHAIDASGILATYVCVEGDTPQRVSQRFYRTPDHAVDILQANRLPLHQPSFFKGKVLIIPVLSSQGPGSNGAGGA